MLWELALIFLRLGATSFGGPLAHIALMRLEFVERRGWLSERDFLDLNGAVNLVPGPNSTELAMHIGWKRAGFAGLCVAGACFIFPAMLLVLMLAALYSRLGTLPDARALLRGASPVVVVLIAQALWKFAFTALQTKRACLIAFFSLLAVALKASEVAVVFGSALIGLVLARFETPSSPSPTGIKRPNPAVFFLGATGAATSASVAGVFWTFLKIGCLVYGSGYVLIAYLRAELVEHAGLISSQQLLDAVAIGQITPGPVFTTATFIGFQIAGFWGALAATAGIFAPGFVFVALLGTVLDRLKDSSRARIFLECVNAASLAIMAFVSFQLARETLVRGGQVDGLALFIGAGAALGIGKTRVNPAWFLGLGALVGLVFRAH